jgi:hypothetical protein
MELLTQQEAIFLLFKLSQGVIESNTDKEYFEESPLDDRIWTERSLIPTTAPTLDPDETLGVVQRKVDVALVQVPGNNKAFYHADLIDAIPFNYGDGSYNWVVKDSLGNVIPSGQNRWLKAKYSRVLYFYAGAPVNMPPTISFYKYVGTKDEFAAVVGAGNADEKYRGPYDPTTGELPTNGSGTAGAVRKGDFWKIGTAGTISGLVPEPKVKIGDLLFAGINGAAVASDFFAINVNIDTALFALTTDTRFPTANQKAAMDQSASPSNSNPFITQSQLFALGVSWRGDHSAAAGALPISGSGSGGAIRAGDLWRISAAGIITGLLPFENLQINDVLIAKSDGANTASQFLSIRSFFLTLNDTWANEETDVIVVGTNSDDIIHISGLLKTGTVRTKFDLIITHDGTDPEFDFQMNPYRTQFETLFTGIAFNGSNIELSYDVGSLGASITIQAIINKFKL